jgi:hypothetical protein
VRRPATHGRPNAGWATAWQPNPAGQLAARAQAWGRRGGVLAGGSAVARRWQGVAGDLEGVTGKVPGKEERTEAHRNGGSIVRRCQRRRAAAFVSGEGAPVVAGVVEEVLQLGRGEGVRKLQEIPGIGSSGKSLPGRGGRRRRPAEIHEGEAGSGGRRRRSGCGEWRGGSSAQESGWRGVKNRVSERSGARRSALGGSAAERGKRGGERRSRAWGCHAARGSSWGPVPTGGWRRQQFARGAGGRRAPRTHVRSETERERED